MEWLHDQGRGAVNKRLYLPTSVVMRFRREGMEKAAFEWAEGWGLKPPFTLLIGTKKCYNWVGLEYWVDHYQVEGQM